MEFKAMQLSLEGSVLIEASAGTGKTYTLKHIVLRLIVEKEIPIDRLVVVTFTKAATRELMNRIRQDLQCLLAVVKNRMANDDGAGEAAGAIDQNLEAQLQRWLTDGKTLSQIAWLLERALQDFDHAHINTIHSFCADMLKDNIFSRAGLLQTDIDSMKSTAIIDRVIRDFELFALHSDAPESVVRAMLTDDAKWFRALLREVLKLGARAQDACEIVGEGPARTLIEAFLEQVPASVEALKNEQAVMDFDDILVMMHRSVQGNPDFAQTVRSQFDAILIDEFQDTDPLQYAIFSELFMKNEAATVIFVGDPKQSIYRFRNAQLETYEQARDNDVENCVTLEKNFRTTGFALEAVNRFFARTGDGVKVFGGKIYSPVQSDSRRLPLVRVNKDGHLEPVSAFSMLINDRDSASEKQSAKELALKRMAQEIEWLLTEKIYKAPDRLLEASDIAILVAARTDADELVKLLAQRGIRVIRKDQNDVLQTEEADDLLCVLQAIETSDDVKLLKIALTGRLMGGTLSGVTASVESLAQARETIVRAQTLFTQNGPVAALRYLMQSSHTAGRLLGVINGERRLENYRHLTELLNEVWQQIKSISGVIRWMQSERNSERETPAERVIRTESDEGMVVVDTIHHAKGLEYPVVFLPGSIKKIRLSAEDRNVFGSIFKEAGSEQSKLVIALGETESLKDDDQQRLQALRAHTIEQDIGEAIRKAYVALTRASARIVLPLAVRYTQKKAVHGGDVKNAYFAALTNTAGDTAPGTTEIWEGFDRILQKDASYQCIAQSTYKALCEAYGENYVAPAEEWPDMIDSVDVYHLQPLRNICNRERAEKATLTVLTPAPKQSTGWMQTSFSGLTRGIAAELPSEEKTDDEVGPDQTQPVAALAVNDILNMPSSADVGSCLHKIFENADFARVAKAISEHRELDDDYIDKLCYRTLTAAGLVTDRESGEKDKMNYVQAVKTMLCDVLGKDLSGLKSVDGSARPLRGCQLMRVGSHLSEGEFLTGLCLESQVAPTTTELENFLATVTDDGRYRIEGLQYRELHGFLTGAIDMIFFHAGKFWVLDWKSNRIRSQVSQATDYTEGVMKEEIKHHHYDLQYLIYLVALKRYLKLRFPHVRDVTRYIGGALYVFVRGVRRDDPGTAGLYLDCVPGHVIDAFDQFLLNSEKRHATEASE